MLANPPWRQLRERAEKIPGDKKPDFELGGFSHRVIALRSSIQHRNALAAFADTLLDSVAGFSGYNSARAQEDDITLLVLDFQ